MPSVSAKSRGPRPPDYIPPDGTYWRSVAASAFLFALVLLFIILFGSWICPRIRKQSTSSQPLEGRRRQNQGLFGPGNTDSVSSSRPTDLANAEEGRHDRKRIRRQAPSLTESPAKQRRLRCTLDTQPLVSASSAGRRLGYETIASVGSVRALGCSPPDRFKKARRNAPRSFDALWRHPRVDTPPDSGYSTLDQRMQTEQGPEKKRVGVLQPAAMIGTASCGSQLIATTPEDAPEGPHPDAVSRNDPLSANRNVWTTLKVYSCGCKDPSDIPRDFQKFSKLSRVHMQRANLLSGGGAVFVKYEDRTDALAAYMGMWQSTDYQVEWIEPTPDPAEDTHTAVELEGEQAKHHWITPPPVVDLTGTASQNPRMNGHHAVAPRPYSRCDTIRLKSHAPHRVKINEYFSKRQASETFDASSDSSKSDEEIFSPRFERTAW